MQARLNGQLVLEGEIYEPLRGPWIATLQVDQTAADASATALTGPVALELGTERFLGTASGAAEAGRYRLELVGGAGGLKREVDAKYYYQTSAQVVIDDLLRATGELLDVQLSDPLITSYLLDRWARRKGEARAALSELVAAAGGYWRVGRSGGLVLLREDAWQPIATDYVEVMRDPASATVEIAPNEAALARPGLSLPSGERIVEVHSLIQSSSFRQVLALDLAGSGQLRTAAHATVDAARRAGEAASAYSQWYPARVVKQDGDGSVQLLADDLRIRGNGITHVPLRHGVPGVHVRVKEGERVILFFENGDPQKPAAALWPDGSSVREVRASALERLLFIAPETRLGSEDAQQRMVLGDLLDALLRSLSVSTAMGPSGPPITTPVWDEYLSSKHKLDG